MKKIIEKIKTAKQSLHSKLLAHMKERLKGSRCSVVSHISKIEIGNLLVALSTTGLMALGVIPLSMSVLISLAVLLVIIGIIGRYLDEIEDDAERLLSYEKHLAEGVACIVPDTSSCESLQQQNVVGKDARNKSTGRKAKSGRAKD